MSRRKQRQDGSRKAKPAELSDDALKKAQGGGFASTSTSSADTDRTTAVKTSLKKRFERDLTPP